MEAQFKLSPEAVAVVQARVDREGVSLEQAMEDIVINHAFLSAAATKGDRILLEEKPTLWDKINCQGGKLKQVILNP